MHIGILIRFILGYLRIEVEGYYIEKFINLCQNNKILIWNLKKQKGVKLFLSIGIKDFKKLKQIVRITKCKVKIKDKKGIPFLLYRYKKRKLFGILLIITLLVIYISSKYVWNIEIQADENSQIENIQEELEKLGVKKGILKSSIDVTNVINEIRLKRNDISWIGVDIKGTNIIFKIVKATDKPEIVDENDYCNIIASKKGVISKIIAQKGTAMVKEGEEVEKGDLLIAGVMEGKYSEKKYVHSMRRNRS